MDKPRPKLGPDGIRALRGTLSRSELAGRVGVRAAHRLYRWELPADAPEARRPDLYGRYSSPFTGLGEAIVVEDDPALLGRLTLDGYQARPERAIVIRVAAWDANCPQHIPQLLRAEDATLLRRSENAGLRVSGERSCVPPQPVFPEPSPALAGGGFVPRISLLVNGGVPLSYGIGAGGAEIRAIGFGVAGARVSASRVRAPERPDR